MLIPLLSYSDIKLSGGLYFPMTGGNVSGWVDQNGNSIIQLKPTAIALSSSLQYLSPINIGIGIDFRPFTFLELPLNRHEQVYCPVYFTNFINFYNLQFQYKIGYLQPEGLYWGMSFGKYNGLCFLADFGVSNFNLGNAGGYFIAGMGVQKDFLFKHDYKESSSVANWICGTAGFLTPYIIMITLMLTNSTGN
jgi:hypothetical protein